MILAWLSRFQILLIGVTFYLKADRQYANTKC